MINNIGRPDGRPEVFELPRGSSGECAFCYHRGITFWVRRDTGFLVSGAYSPHPMGAPQMVCLQHLKSMWPNVVIVDPDAYDMESGQTTCRDLDGNSWRE